jgi:hypothetical protein
MGFRNAPVSRTLKTAPSGPRVEIDSDQAERIQLFTGDLGELAPGRIYSGILPGSGGTNGDRGFMALAPPELGTVIALFPEVGFYAVGQSRDGVVPGSWQLAGPLVGDQWTAKSLVLSTAQGPEVNAVVQQYYLNQRLTTAPLSPAYTTGTPPPFSDFGSGFKAWRVWLDVDGKTVHSEGVIKNFAAIGAGGTSPTVATLPAGYRPASTAEIGIVVQGSVAARCDVASTGAVVIINNGAAAIGAGSFISMHFAYRAD